MSKQKRAHSDGSGRRRRLRGLLLYHDGPELYLSRGYRLYHSADGGATLRRIATLPRASARERLARTGVGRRLTRGYIRHLLPTGGGLVLLAGRRFYRLSAAARGPAAEPAAEHTAAQDGAASSGAPAAGWMPEPGREAAGGFRRPGGTASGAAPYHVQPGAFAVGRQPLHLAATAQGLYYGEYRNNPERSPVAVYKSVDGGLSFFLHTRFDGVRHIHGVFSDPWEADTLLVATGDEDAESAIWRLPGAGGEPLQLAGGSQRYRAVTVIPREEALYFGTDAPEERNFIYRLERHSGQLSACAEVGGPVFWGTVLPDGTLAFSTVVEPSTINRGRHAELWLSRDGRSFTCVRRYREDLLPRKLFQYAQIRFPAGPGAADELWYSPFACWAHERSEALRPSRERL